jgi:hypothetical protein
MERSADGQHFENFQDVTIILCDGRVSEASKRVSYFHLFIIISSSYLTATKKAVAVERAEVLQSFYWVIFLFSSSICFFRSLRRFSFAIKVSSRDPNWRRKHFNKET